MNRVLALLLILIFLASCGGSSYCISVDGSSDKYGIDEAGVEFCYNPQISEAEKASVFVSPSGEKHFLVHSKYIERANEIIAKDAGAKAAVAPMKQTALQKFCELTQDP